MNQFVHTTSIRCYAQIGTPSKCQTPSHLIAILQPTKSITVFILFIRSIDFSIFLFLIVESLMASASDLPHFAVTITFPTHADEPCVTLDLLYQFQTRSLPLIECLDKQIRSAVVHTSETTIHTKPAEIENPAFHHLFLSKQHNIWRVKRPKKKPSTHSKPSSVPRPPQPPPPSKFMSHPTPTVTLRVSVSHEMPQARVQLSSRHYLYEINLARGSTRHIQRRLFGVASRSLRDTLRACKKI